MKPTSNKENSDEVKTFVRERYANIAENFQAESTNCGCAPTDNKCCSPEAQINPEDIPAIYDSSMIANLPEEVTGLSLGCGDPVTLASLQPGDTVLDLGSGGGIDCFLAAKQVTSTGRVIGVDMTPQMIDRARGNKAKIGIDNVEFRLGEIEHLPVGDNSVDVIISNCVINLSTDKPQVFREAFRALKPGGRLSVSDIVTDGPLPDEIKSSLSAWAGCVAGALDADEYISAIENAGFEDIQLTPVYWDQTVVDEAIDQLDLAHAIPDSKRGETLYKSVYSAKIKARKP